MCVCVACVCECVCLQMLDLSLPSVCSTPRHPKPQKYFKITVQNGLKHCCDFTKKMTFEAILYSSFGKVVDKD